MRTIPAALLLLAAGWLAAAEAPRTKPAKPAKRAKGPAVPAPVPVPPARVIAMAQVRAALSGSAPMAEAPVLDAVGYKIALNRRQPGPGKPRRAKGQSLVLQLTAADIERDGKRRANKRGTVASILPGQLYSGTLLGPGASEFISFHHLWTTKKAPATASGDPLRADLLDLPEPATGGETMRVLPVNDGKPEAFAPSLIFVRRAMTRVPPFKPDTIWIVLSGTAKLRLGETTTNVAEDDLIYLPANSDKPVGLFPEKGTLRMLQVLVDPTK